MSIRKRAQDTLNRITIAETWKARVDKSGISAKEFAKAADVNEFTFNRCANKKAEPSEATVIAVEREFKKRSITTHPHLATIINDILRRADDGSSE